MKRKLHHILGLTIIFFIVVGTNTTFAKFNDISDNYRAINEITFLSEAGVIQGNSDGAFTPNGLLKRSEAATMLGRALNLDGTKKETQFSDVGKSSFSSGYVQSAFENGIISGFTDGTFRPNEIVTRGQMAIMLANAFSLEPTEENFFIDKPVGSKAYMAINKIAAAGISQGIDGYKFMPKEPLTRADFSIFVARSLNPEFRVKALKAEMKTVVIDAGHGGKKGIVYEDGPGDSGAIGYGLYEKDINLDTALQLEELLKSVGINVIMTRQDDRFLSLETRSKIAANSNADAFVSIHSNAGGGTGIETFYYSAAESESKPGTDYIKNSKELATAIQRRMISELGVVDRGEKGANFYVLRETPLPSALVELGFIDREEDAKRLGSSSWRQKAANAISMGIQDYLFDK